MRLDIGQMLAFYTLKEASVTSALFIIVGTADLAIEKRIGPGARWLELEVIEGQVGATSLVKGEVYYKGTRRHTEVLVHNGFDPFVEVKTGGEITRYALEDLFRD